MDNRTGVGLGFVVVWLGCASWIALPSCVAQAAITQRGEDLEPMRTAFSDHEEGAAYRMKIRSRLLRKAPGSPSLQFVIMPSFDPECVLTIDLKGTDYEGLTLRPDQSLWYDKRPAGEVVVAKHEKKVPAEIATRAIALWRALLARVHYQDHQGDSLDGVTFEFLAWEKGRGTRVGESSNPGKGTRGWWLATIGELLVKFVEAPVTEEAPVLNDLGKAFAALEAMLKESGQKTDAKADK